MGFPRKDTAIVGVYTTEQARGIERPPFELELEAMRGALEDAGLSFADVDGIGTTRLQSLIAGSYDPLHFWAEQLGQRPMNFMSSGQPAASLVKGALAVAGGLCKVFVFVHGKSGGVTWNASKAPPPTKARVVGDWSEHLYGATRVSWYALWAQRYMHDFGVSSEDLAQVAIDARYHATLNPNSLMGRRGELTVDEVVNSRMIASPLHLLDCALDNDGGYAIVITSAERARDLKKPPVYVLGGAESFYVDYYHNLPYPLFSLDGGGVRQATKTAMGLAGVTPEDIDVGGLYDCFTVTVLRNLEEMGFCKLGEAKDFIKDGGIRLGGRLPVNTDGGLLSNSHNGNPGGLPVIEVVRQLRRDVEPARQVKDAKVGLALSQGMSIHGVGGVLVLGV